MTKLSLGLRCYLTILMPSLIEELQKVYRKQTQPIDEHDLSRALFIARAIQHRLPDPSSCVETDDIWPEIVKAEQSIRQVLDVLEQDRFDAVAAEAKQRTGKLVRENMRRVFNQRLAEGKADFRLHGVLVSKNTAVDKNDPVVHESLLMKRAHRHALLMEFAEQVLDPAEQVIFNDVRLVIQRFRDNQTGNSPIDTILAMGTVLVYAARIRLNANVPSIIQAKFERMTRKAAMALGAIIYREEYQRYKGLLNLPTSD